MYIDESINPSGRLIGRFKINFLIIPLLIIITASAGSYFAQTGMQWYNTLVLPSFTPPSYMFSIVWSLIFTLAAISLLIIWNKYSKETLFSLVIMLFFLNGLINVGWNVVFFVYHNIGFSVIVAILLAADVLLLIIFIRRFSLIASYLLYPYFIWLIFAAFLSFNVWLLN
ncbi:MAG: TspO/MBR family protein [Ignavibacteriaceae bacterium]